jgi:nucleoside-diphosphate-sugar epimerase
MSHRILITGTSGALGYHVLNELSSQQDTTVLGLLRPNSIIHEAHRDLQYKRIEFSGKSVLQSVVSEFQPTCVVHSAASGLQFPRPEWFDLLRFNVDVSLALCECAAAISGCHFVYISTGMAYRPQDRPLHEADPLDTLHPYGASKAAADLLVRSTASEFGLPLTVIRPFSFTGVGDPANRLFPSILKAAVERKPVNLSQGEQFRDHCATTDIAAGIGKIIHENPAKPDEQRIFNLGSGDVQTLRNMVESVVGQLGLEVCLNFGARPYARHEPMHLVADISRAKQALGWYPMRNLAFSVWELARESHPELTLTIPQEFLSKHHFQN